MSFDDLDARLRVYETSHDPGHHRPSEGESDPSEGRSPASLGDGAS